MAMLMAAEKSMLAMHAKINFEPAQRDPAMLIVIDAGVMKRRAEEREEE
jgi:hypothetical protein